MLAPALGATVALLRRYVGTVFNIALLALRWDRMEAQPLPDTHRPTGCEAPVLRLLCLSIGMLLWIVTLLAQPRQRRASGRARDERSRPKRAGELKLPRT